MTILLAAGDLPAMPNWVAWLLGVITVGALGFAWFSYRRPRRARLMIGGTRVSLAPPKAARAEIQVIFKGKAVEDPRILTIEVSHVGGPDVPPWGERERLAANLGPGLVGLLASDDEVATVQGNHVVFTPRLFQYRGVKQRVAVSALVSGGVDWEPQVEINGVDSIRWDEVQKRRRMFHATLGLLVALSALALGVMLIVAPSRFSQTPHVLEFMGVLVGVSGLAVALPLWLDAVRPRR